MLNLTHETTLSSPDAKFDSVTVRDFDSNSLARNMNKSILINIADKFISEDGSAVDYSAIKESESFQIFRNDTYKLHQVDLDVLSDNEKKTFFLNIYNALVIHGNIERGVPNSLSSRVSFYRRVSYRIGPHAYSLDDIEHGILRGNRKHSSFLFQKKQFGKKDARRCFALTSCDPRLHFALNCGAKSCPPIRIYSADNLDYGLNAAAFNFCNDDSNFKVDVPNRQIVISQIFKWYKSDFGKHKKDVIQWISRYLLPYTKAELFEVLESDRYQISYAKYDWQLNDESVSAETQAEIEKPQANSEL